MQKSFAVTLSLLVAAPAAQAQHVIDRAALDRAVANEVAAVQADRETVLALLARPEVRELSRKVGLSVRKAEVAVRSLSPNDVRQLAREVRRVEDEIAGGSVGKTVLTVLITLAILLVLVSLTLTFEAG